MVTFAENILSFFIKLLSVFAVLLLSVFSSEAISINSINYERVCHNYFSFELKNEERIILYTNQNLENAITAGQFSGSEYSKGMIAVRVAVRGVRQL